MIRTRYRDLLDDLSSSHVHPTESIVAESSADVLFQDTSVREEVVKAEKVATSSVDEDTYEEYTPAYISDWARFLPLSKQLFEKRYSQPLSSNYKIYTKLDLVNTMIQSNYFLIKLAIDHKTRKMYYFKMFLKRDINNFGYKRLLNYEKDILMAIRFPFTSHMLAYHEDKERICFLLPPLAGGTLSNRIKTFGPLNENFTKFYAAQILLALEYLHNLSIVYRNLRPETITLHHDGYVKLSDFGFSKVLEFRTFTLCGLQEYFAPEMILYKGYGCSIDLWAWAVLIYELGCGFTPFHPLNTSKYDDDNILVNKILKGKFLCPQSFSKQLKVLLKLMLEPDVTKRLGNLQKGIDEVKENDWFSGLNWCALLNRTTDPTYRPDESHLVFPTDYEQLCSEWTKKAESGEDEYKLFSNIEGFDLQWNI